MPEVEHTLTCERRTGQSYINRPICGKPATEAIGKGGIRDEIVYEALCKAHAGVERRRISGTEPFLLTASVVEVIEARKKIYADAKAERNRAKQKENANRMEAYKAARKEEAGQEYVCDATDKRRFVFGGEEVTPTWTIHPKEGAVTSFGTTVVIVDRQEGFPTTVEIKGKTTLDLNAVPLLSQALQEALSVAQEGQ